MSSEAALEAAPMVGNAHLGQRGSGHSVVSLPNTYPGIDRESCGLGARRGCGQTMRARGVCAPALELPLAWEGPYSARWQAEPRSEPDSGNPTVRDRRGALRNVTHGGTRNPLRNRKSGSGHSSPKGARAQLLSRHPLAAFEVAGAGNGVTVRSTRARMGKPGIQTRPEPHGLPRQPSTLPPCRIRRMNKEDRQPPNANCAFAGRRIWC